MSGILNLLFEGDHCLEPSQILRIAKREGMKLAAKAYCCAVIKHDARIEDEEEYEKYCFRLSAGCENYLAGLSIRAFAQDNGRRSCRLLILDVVSNAILENCIRGLSEYLEKHRYGHMVIGVGTVVFSIKEIARSFEDANYALQYRYHIPAAGIVFFRDAQAIYPSFSLDFSQEMEEILESFRIGDLKRIRSLAVCYAEKVRGYTRFRPDGPYPTGIKRMFVELTVRVLHITSDTGADVDALLGGQDPYLQVISCSSTPQLIEWFLELCKKMQMEISSRAFRRNNSLIDDAKRYIQLHLSSSSLSQTEVGEQLGVTASYLSTLFAAETGVGFSTYVKQARLARAKELLRNSDHSIVEISRMSGFSSPGYFNRVFRSEERMTPGQYRADN